MACILRITGKHWDVDRFAARSGAQPDERYRRGEMTDPPGAYRIKVSGMSWVLGPHAFVSLRRQVAAATRFLEDVALIGKFGLDVVLSHYPVEAAAGSRRAIRHRGTARVPKTASGSGRQRRPRQQE
jgi:hypothetical protein